MSVDGTDCPIQEPSLFSSEWYSHKLNGPGVRYEIAVSLHSAKAVWASGPFQPGKFPDVTIFRQGLRKRLSSQEYVVADDGYGDTKCIKPPGEHHPQHWPLTYIRQRHENFNKRLKQFSVLKTAFRHDRSLHSVCFYAVLNLTQVQLRYEPLFAIDLQ